MTYWVNVYEDGAGNPWRDKQIAVLATVAKHNPLYRIKVTLKGKA